MRRRGIMLATVLIMLAVLAVIMAGFMFFLRAETVGVIGYLDGQQARLAAESGFEELAYLLRKAETRNDSTLWYDRPDLLRHRLVFSPAYDRQNDPLADEENRSRLDLFEEDGAPDVAWRYSVVAPIYETGNTTRFRYGMTPESGKLNINAATDAQLTQLLSGLLPALGVENTPELIAALLDWRDADDEPREGGAESEYYATLSPPYAPKNGALDTLEELLLIKGFNAAILWGEDTNRNGLLEPNEDDGEDRFPPYDNGDGILDHGIAPFLTIWSREPDSASDNKPRINLHSNGATVTGLIAEYVEEDTLSEATIGYLVNMAGSDTVDRLRSPADLYRGPDEELDGNSPWLNNSPVLLEELPVLMDRFSVRPAEEAAVTIFNRINVNTAPQRVLELIPGMTPDAATSLVLTRRTASAEALKTPAWPLTLEALETPVFKEIAPYLTTHAYQFHVEILGYADHTKLTRRYEWVVELAGPLAQIKYYRDLTGLGPAWPVDRELPEVITRE